jgi:hypothetical protein
MANFTNTSGIKLVFGGNNASGTVSGTFDGLTGPKLITSDVITAQEMSDLSTYFGK